MSEELSEKVEAREEIKRTLPERQPPELDWTALKDNSFNQIGNTLKFNPYLFSKALLQQELFLTFRDNESLYKYEKEKGIWHNGTDPHVKEIASQILKTEITTHTLNECLTSIKVQTYIDRAETEEKQKGLVPLKNGVYNLATNQMQEYQPNYYFTTQIPVTYNPSATCPKIDLFLSEIVDPTDLPILYEIFAFCLMDGYPITKAILLIGAGANGKSTYLRLLTAFLGKNNISSIPLQLLGGEKNKFAVARLYKKYANICADLSNQSLRITGPFLLLTGDDSVSAEEKFKEGFDFDNRAKLIFSANEAPPLYQDTDAIYRRWLLIVFPNQFVGNKNKKGLFAELTTEEELSGLLNKVLPLIQKLKEFEFSQPKTIEETRAQYKRLSSSVFSFSERVVELSDAWIETEIIFNAYLKHCASIKSIPRSREIFFKELRGFCPYFYPSRRRIDGILVQGYAGLKIDGLEDISLENTEKTGVQGIPRILSPFGGNLSDFLEVKTAPDCESSQETLKRTDFNSTVQGVQGKNALKVGLEQQYKGKNTPEHMNTLNNTEPTPKLYQLPPAILHIITKQGPQTPDQLYLALKSTFPALATLQLGDFEHVLEKMREKGELYEVSVGVLGKV